MLLRNRVLVNNVTLHYIIKANIIHQHDHQLCGLKPNCEALQNNSFILQNTGITRNMLSLLS